MGLFSSSSSNSTTTNTTSNAQENPLSITESGLSLAPVFAPNIQGSSGNESFSNQEYYAPLSIDASQNYGDSAVQANAATQQQAIEAAGGPGGNSVASDISSLFNSTTFAWIVAAIAVLLFAKQFGRLI